MIEPIAAPNAAGSPLRLARLDAAQVRQAETRALDAAVAAPGDGDARGRRRRRRRTASPGSSTHAPDNAPEKRPIAPNADGLCVSPEAYYEAEQPCAAGRRCARRREEAPPERRERSRLRPPRPRRASSVVVVAPRAPNRRAPRALLPPPPPFPSGGQASPENTPHEADKIDQLGNFLLRITGFNKATQAILTLRNATIITAGGRVFMAKLARRLLAQNLARRRVKAAVIGSTIRGFDPRALEGPGRDEERMRQVEGPAAAN